jgi:hypothetical protein
MREIHHLAGFVMGVDWQEKVWGRTRELVDSPFYSKHALEVIVGTYCSLHYHRQRANRFIIFTGLIEIIEMYGPAVKKTKLGPDTAYDVPSLVPHMFVVHKNGDDY